MYSRVDCFKYFFCFSSFVVHFVSELMVESIFLLPFQCTVPLFTSWRQVTESNYILNIFISFCPATLSICLDLFRFILYYI